MPQVNLSHLSPTSIKNFSIRNTTSTITTGVGRLHQVPQRNSVFELPLLCCPDIADDSGGQVPPLLPFISPSPPVDQRDAREASPPSPDGLTSPGLPDPGAQHAPAQPPPRASPAVLRRSTPSSASGATLHVGLNKPLCIIYLVSN